MIRCFLTCLLLIVYTRLAAQWTPESIPNQKLINNSYVSNPDKILDEATVSQIDTVLASLEKNTSAQVAVVVVSSIGEEDIFEFAQKLFTTWAIGNREKDNGLLVLLVEDKHTVRFHTGYGLEGVLPDITCKRIQRDHMVPEFKKGNYNAGMLAGIQEVSKIISDPAYASEVKEDKKDDVSDFTGFVIFFSIFVAPAILIVFVVKATQGKFTDSKKTAATPYPEMRLSRQTWLIEFAGIPVLIVAGFGISGVEGASWLCFISLYLYFLSTLFHRLWRMKKVINRFLEKDDYYEIVEFIRKQQWYWFLMGLAFPFPFLFYFFYHLFRKRLYRNHPRACKKCQGAMHKLSEKTEDEYLSQGMQMEETLRSVDYDVWKCNACQAVELCFYLNRHSKYQPCPKCRTIAYYAASRRTVEPATYSSAGSGEEVHNCKFCGYSKKSSYSIAKLVASSGSSGGSSFSSGSSSGGSWGGGSSGGGGASSSW